MEKLTQCPVCKSNSFQHFLNVKDYSVTQETFTLDQCKDCGFIFTNPRPTEEGIGKYYAFEDYISHTNTNKGFINKAYQWVRNYTLNQKKDLVEKLNGGKGTITDIGCGTGHFLKTCKDNGWKVNGSEPSDDARKIATNQTQQEIKTQVYDLGATSDIVTLWHVLEHIHQLDKTLVHIESLVKKGGHLIIALPNHRSWDAIHYTEHWAAYDVPRHLYHFNKDTVKNLIEQHGFKMIKVKPMLFDSLYVSMLSEKYLGKGLASVRGALNGLRSNLSAAGKKEYSSHIYIFKKD
jgi:2-polyprenyl-3-methyl-5-hydroxy-6-metoxy-1,4-benzoquinol methylase